MDGPARLLRVLQRGRSSVGWGYHSPAGNALPHTVRIGGAARADEPMRIAITADLHLTTKKEHPERYEALKEVLRQCGELEVDRLIIAGDLFDRSQANFAEFEKACAAARPGRLPVTVIPGNHDPHLTSGSLTLEAVEVLEEPTLRSLEDGFQLLYVPYAEQAAMGEPLAPFRSLLEPEAWALIGHGDWAAGRRTLNPYEPGTYMPLTRADVDSYRPAAVLLGHIHAPTDDPPVYYPGSPCPLDINETGLRRFLVLDSQSRSVTSQPVDSPRLFFNETVVMLPMEDEPAFLQAELARRIERWGVPQERQDRVRVRLRVVGYSADRAGLDAAARQAMAGFEFYDEGPDLSQLNQAADVDRIHIARQVRQWIEALDWQGSQAAEPTAEQITLEALRVIWGD